MKLTLLEEISIGILTLCIGVAIVLFSCGRPTPPDPLTVTDFSVVSEKVLIDGKLKPNSPVSVFEAKRSIQVAADMIGAKNK